MPPNEMRAKWKQLAKMVAGQREIMSSLQSDRVKAFEQLQKLLQVRLYKFVSWMVNYENVVLRQCKKQALAEGLRRSIVASTDKARRSRILPFAIPLLRRYSPTR